MEKKPKRQNRKFIEKYKCEKCGLKFRIKAAYKNHLLDHKKYDNNRRRG